MGELLDFKEAECVCAVFSRCSETLSFREILCKQITNPSDERLISFTAEIDGAKF